MICKRSSKLTLESLNQIPNDKSPLTVQTHSSLSADKIAYLLTIQYCCLFRLFYFCYLIYRVYFLLIYIRYLIHGVYFLFSHSRIIFLIKSPISNMPILCMHYLLNCLLSSTLGLVLCIII